MGANRLSFVLLKSSCVISGILTPRLLPAFFIQNDGVEKEREVHPMLPNEPIHLSFGAFQGPVCLMLNAGRIEVR